MIKIANLLILFALAACKPAALAEPTVDATRLFESALLTATYAIPAPTDTPAPPETPGPTDTPPPDPNITPPALPAVFTSTLLNPVDAPHTYINDTCQYLKARWDPNNAAPGTVVIPVMFHSITGGEVTNADQISHEEFTHLMRDLYDQGFQTITAEQLANFMENNAKIPKRSMILIVDDRKWAENYRINFQPYFQDFGWTVTNAWISKDERPDLWADNQALAAEGWVDYQAHGVIHNENITELSTEEYMRSELFGAVDGVLRLSGRKPVAYIWPGGSFTRRAVEIAREAGYRIGFTINPRGPVMYNWVPLADAADPNRPSYIPEGGVNDPLMVLPRYWDTDMRYHIDTARQVGNEATIYAETNKAVELQYYDIVCKPITGEIPAQVAP